MSNKKSSYDFSFKLKVVKYAEENSKNKASKVFEVDRRRVKEWCQQKDKSKVMSKTSKRLQGGGRKVRYPDIEEKLPQWLNERRNKGVRLTGKALKREAMRFHKTSEKQSLKVSCGWFRKFKRRNNITFRATTHVAQ